MDLPFTRFFGLLRGLIALAVFCGLPFGIAGISFSRVGEISNAISSEPSGKLRNYSFWFCAKVQEERMAYMENDLPISFPR